MSIAKRVSAILVIGALAALGEVAGTMVGMLIGGKSAIVVSASTLLLMGVGAGALIAAPSGPTRGGWLLGLLASVALTVAATGLALSRLGETSFGADTINPLFMGWPLLLGWTVAALWVGLVGTR